MYQLYYSAGACSLAVHVILNELDVEFEAISANKPGSKERSAEFLEVMPNGYVPVLMIDGQPVTEGGAIITYLCDTHKSHLIPSEGMERARALEALMLCNATLHPAYGRAFGAGRQFEGATKDEVAKKAGESVQKIWDAIEARLVKQKYLAGNEVTAGDILMTVIAGWNGIFGDTVKIGPNAMRVVSEIRTRPAYQQAVQTENAETKAAA